MSAQDDLRASLEAIMVAKRDELGEEPTPEELLAYRDGRLSPEARAAVEARLAVYPDAARALADLAAFPDVEPAPGVPALSDDEVEARWRAFRERLGDTQPAPPAALQPPPPPRERPATPRRPFGPRLAAAAMLGVAIGGAGGFLAGRGSRPGASADVEIVEIVELAPLGEGGARSEGTAVELGPAAEGLVLVLGAPPPDGRGGGRGGDRVEIRDEAGALVWSREGLRPTSLGTVQLSFDRGALEPGSYRLTLFGRDGERRTPLAIYELRLREGSEPR